MVPILNALVRPARLDDIQAITAIHVSDIATWQFFADGEPRPARYEELSLHQRFMNGGPWMSVETCAIHLAHLIRTPGCFALVAEVDGVARGEAELFLGQEPLPFGRNLNLSILYVHRDWHGRGLGTALMRQALALADELDCQSFTVANADLPDFYARFGLAAHGDWVRVRVPPRRTEVAYQAESQPPADYALISGWAMPLGRYQSARQEWERWQPCAVAPFAEWQDSLGYVWRVHSRSHTAIVRVAADWRDPAEGRLEMWTPNPDSRSLIEIALDLAFQSPFRSLNCLVPAADVARIPGAWAAPDAYRQQLLLKVLRSKS